MSELGKLINISGNIDTYAWTNVILHVEYDTWGTVDAHVRVDVTRYAILSIQLEHVQKTLWRPFTPKKLEDAYKILLDNVK